MTRPGTPLTLIMISLLGCFCALPASAAESERETYGAQPDALGPIGGGAGYQRIVTRGDYTVSTIDELVGALSKAKAGQVVYLNGEAELDLTVRVRAHEDGRALVVVRPTARDSEAAQEAEEPPLARLQNLLESKDSQLAIARNIVVTHGGDLWVETSGDAGAALHLALPVD